MFVDERRAGGVHHFPGIAAGLPGKSFLVLFGNNDLHGGNSGV